MRPFSSNAKADAWILSEKKDFTFILDGKIWKKHKVLDQTSLSDLRQDLHLSDLVSFINSGFAVHTSSEKDLKIADIVQNQSQIMMATSEDDFWGIPEQVNYQNPKYLSKSVSVTVKNFLHAQEPQQNPHFSESDLHDLNYNVAGISNEPERPTAVIGTVGKQKLWPAIKPTKQPPVGIKRPQTASPYVADIQRDLLAKLKQNPQLAHDKAFMQVLEAAISPVADVFAEDDVIKSPVIEDLDIDFPHATPANQSSVPHATPANRFDVVHPTSAPQEQRFPVLKNAKSLGMQKGFELLLYPQILPKANPKKPHLAVLDPQKLEKAKFAIVLGETGTGKSTQLNALVNFLLGVKIDDPFRYQLVQENTSNDQSRSQTAEVNLYCVESQIGYDPLVLIDTPGYGDTRGIDKDAEIDRMLQDLFTSDVDRIHLVCFVTKSSSIRLTSIQNYVFNKVLQMFGKDVAENFLFVLTFCDGGDPVVVKSLETSSIIGPIVNTIKGDWYLRFNNSAMFSAYKQDKPDQMQQFYWDLCYASMKEFMKKLSITEGKSLTLSKEVIKERKTLDAQISGLQLTLQQGLAQTAKLEEILDQFQRNYHQMDQSKNFVITVDEPVVQEKQLPVGMHTTRCTKCNRTCHKNCGVIPPASKETCSAMRNGSCTVCDGKCHHSQHINSEFEIVHSTKKVTVRQADLEARYKDAKNGMSVKEKVIYGLLDEIDEYQNKCLVIQHKLKDSIDRLDRIALRPNCFKSINEYIEQMIKAEKDSKETGWSLRVETLEAMRKKNELAEKLMQKETTVFKPKLEVLRELERKGILKTPAKDKAAERGWFKRLFS